MLPAAVPPDVAPFLPELIAAYETALRPASTRDAGVVLAKLATHYWQPERPAEHHRIVYEDLIGDLGGYPLGVIAEAADEWRRTHCWAPKCCEMIALCDRIAHQRRVELVRLRFFRWCVETYDGKCPRLMRRIGDRLVDYGDPTTTSLLEAALDGQTEFFGDLVLVPPGAALPSNRPDPAIVEHRQQVRDILAGAGFSAVERLAFGDVTIERAETLAAERIAERQRSACRQRVLQILLSGGIGVPEIERRMLLDLAEDEARALVEERARHAAAIAAAETVAPGSGTVQ